MLVVNNPAASPILGFNGEFIVSEVVDARFFKYKLTDTDGFVRDPGGFTNDTNDRNVLLPRFERNNNDNNVFIYRVETITDFVEGIRDGIYHLYCVNGGNRVTETFTDRLYNQPIENLYPQQDLDNLRDNPPASVTFANRAPLGKTTIDEPQNSITRESIDRGVRSTNRNQIASHVDGAIGAGGTYTTTVTFERDHIFNGVYSYTAIFGGSGYADGEYYNVKLFSNAGTLWKGATANVEIAGGSLASLVIMDPGSGYQPGESLVIDPASTGGGTNGYIDITAADIEINVGSVVQISGGGQQNPDSYSYVSEVPSSNTIVIARDASSPEIEDGIGMYAFTPDSATPISGYAFDSVTGISTFTSTTAGFGLQRGNSVVGFGSDGSYLGKFYVKNVPNTHTDGGSY